MIKIRCNLRKYAALLAIVLLPDGAFAKGAVIGYWSGDGTALNDEQLNRLTHVMAVDVYPDANGYLYSQTLWGGSNPNPIQIWNPNQTNAKLEGSNGLVNRAHARNVNVSIVISHNKNFNHFSSATQDGAHRDTLVAQIVRFVRKFNMDGVVIDWEGSKTYAQWDQCVKLLTDLRAKFAALNMQNKSI